MKKLIPILFLILASNTFANVFVATNDFTNLSTVFTNITANQQVRFRTCVHQGTNIQNIAGYEYNVRLYDYRDDELVNTYTGYVENLDLGTVRWIYDSGIPEGQWTLKQVLTNEIQELEVGRYVLTSAAECDDCASVLVVMTNVIEGQTIITTNIFEGNTYVFTNIIEDITVITTNEITVNADVVLTNVITVITTNIFEGNTFITTNFFDTTINITNLIIGSGGGGVTQFQSRVGSFFLSSSNNSVVFNVLTNGPDDWIIDMVAVIQGGAFPASAIGTNRWSTSGDIALTNYLALPALATNIQAWLWGGGGGTTYGAPGEAVWIESKPGSIPPGSTLMAVCGEGGEAVTNANYSTTNFYQSSSARNGGGRAVIRGAYAAHAGGGGAYSALYLVGGSSNILLAVAAGGPGGTSAGQTGGGGGGGTGSTAGTGQAGGAASETNGGAAASAPAGWTSQVPATPGTNWLAGDSGCTTGTITAAVGGPSSGFYGGGGSHNGSAAAHNAGGSSGAGYINSDYCIGVRIRSTASSGVGTLPPLAELGEWYTGAGVSGASTHGARGGSGACTVGY